MSASRYVTSAPRYKSRSSMYIRSLIPRNYTVLAEAVPIGYVSTHFKRYDIVVFTKTRIYKACGINRESIRI